MAILPPLFYCANASGWANFTRFFEGDYIVNRNAKMTAPTQPNTVGVRERALLNPFLDRAIADLPPNSQLWHCIEIFDWFGLYGHKMNHNRLAQMCQSSHGMILG
jgi:hypothetical protein